MLFECSQIVNFQYSQTTVLQINIAVLLVKGRTTKYGYESIMGKDATDVSGLGLVKCSK